MASEAGPGGGAAARRQRPEPWREGSRIIVALDELDQGVAVAMNRRDAQHAALVARSRSGGIAGCGAAAGGFVERLARVGNLEGDDADAVAMLKDELRDRIVGPSAVVSTKPDVALRQHVGGRSRDSGLEPPVARSLWKPKRSA